MKVIGWSAIAILTLGAGAWFTMLRMPGKSFVGAPGPLTADEAALSGELRKDVQKLAIEIGERNLVHYEGLSAAASYLERSLSDAGYRVERNEFEAATANGPRTTYNIVAELRGAQRPKEIAILGAHYDSRDGTPGADDNASGSAAVLALARMFAKSSPDRTLRFVFFTNEEYFRTDIRGSLRYARLCRARNENIVAMLSLETIGYYSDVSGSQRHPFPLNLFYPSTGDFLCVVGNVASRSLVRTVTGAFRRVAKVASEGVTAPGSIDGVGWSDQLSFWEQGYPGIMITDTAPFRNPNYHGRSDMPETLDYRRLARVVVGLENVVRELVAMEGKVKDHFSADYGGAQQRFREGVARKGGRLDSLELTAKGPAGEALAIDIGWFGDTHAERVLVHSSGIHGVEAFAGSAIQLQFLAGGIPALQAGEAIVLVHVVNPYGMAWLRRFNENNVDLNRNFLAMGEEFSGAPDGYRKLDGFLNPTTPPGGDYFYLRAAALIARYGLGALRQAVAGGQYDYPKGLFFGGHRIEEGPAKLRDYLAGRLRGVQRIAAIDVHTGLGDFGEDHLLVDGDGNGEAAQSMLEVYGERVQGLDPSGVAYKVRGDQGGVYRQLFPEAKTHFATQEFGTYNAVRAVAALRAENRWHLYGGGAMDHATKRDLVEVFNPSSDKWRWAVLQRGREVMQQGLTLAFGRNRS